MLKLFFVNDTTSTEIYTLSLHDALPISGVAPGRSDGPAARSQLSDNGSLHRVHGLPGPQRDSSAWSHARDRKSTRLNSSHRCISYAVFCLKKKKPYKHR